MMSIYLSACFLLGCDALARIIVASADMPVGIITSLLGGPFFTYLLLKKRPKGIFGISGDLA